MPTSNTLFVGAISFNICNKSYNFGVELISGLDAFGLSNRKKISAFCGIYWYSGHRRDIANNFATSPLSNNIWKNLLHSCWEREPQKFGVQIIAIKIIANSIMGWWLKIGISFSNVVIFVIKNEFSVLFFLLDSHRFRVVGVSPFRDLNWNELTGTIPPEIRSLTALTDL